MTTTRESLQELVHVARFVFMLPTSRTGVLMWIGFLADARDLAARHDVPSVTAVADLCPGGRAHMDLDEVDDVVAVDIVRRYRALG